MGVLLGLLPFIALAALRRLMPPRWALATGFGLAAATLALQFARGNIKSLSLLAVLLLGASALAGWRWPEFARRHGGVAVNGGLALFALGGMLLGHPFSAEFARDTVPQAYWSTPLFLEINRTISLAWGAAFVVATLLAWPWRRPLPAALRSLGGLAVMLAAAGFTAWYPGHAQAAARHGLTSPPPTAPMARLETP